MKPFILSIISKCIYNIFFSIIIFLSLVHLSQSQTWTQLTTFAPEVRRGNTLVNDTVNNRVILFGGYHSYMDKNTGLWAYKLFNDVWILTNANGLGGNPVWSQLTVSGSVPPTRWGHTAVYDAEHNQMIIFGGQSSTNTTEYNDVWVLNHANGLGGIPTWTQITTTGNSPEARMYHSAVYDAVNNIMIIFGGDGYDVLNDTWVLSHANGSGGTPTWTQLSTSGPQARADHAAIYDPVNNRMTIFGGYYWSNTGGMPSLNDVWVLTNANGIGGTPRWTQLNTSTGPGYIFGEAAVYDASSNRMIVFGGFPMQIPSNAVWVLSHANGLGGNSVWSRIRPTGSCPTSFFDNQGVYDPVSNRMTIFGGTYLDTFELPVNFDVGWVFMNSVFVLSNANGSGGTPEWIHLSTSEGPPDPRREHTAIYDKKNNRMTIFGGDITYEYVNDLWVLVNANGQGGAPYWNRLFPTGSSPTTLLGESAVYDSINNRMIMFGGSWNAIYNHTWVLSTANGLEGNSGWSKLSTSTSPPYLAWHSAVYDEVNNRMVVFGGYGGDGTYSPKNDVWVLSNANGLGRTPVWSKLTTTGITPPERLWHLAIYDVSNNRMVIYGGSHDWGAEELLQDVWVLSNANGLGGIPTWNQLSTVGDAPLYVSSAIYEVENNRMVISGGTYGNEIWVLNHANGLEGNPTWSHISVVTNLSFAKSEHTAVYDPINNKIINFGGWDNSTNDHKSNEVWVLDGIVGPPSFPTLPALKLFNGQSLQNAFSLQDYNDGGDATGYNLSDNFLGLASLNGNTASQGAYSSPTTGSNTFVVSNSLGESTITGKVKYSTFKIHKLPQVVLRPGESWNINMINYTVNSNNTHVIPPSFGMADSIIVGDTSQVNAKWSNTSTLLITSTNGFINPTYVDIIAAPITNGPHGVDIDKERINIYPVISTTAFEFGSSNDMNLFSYQTPEGVNALSIVDYTTGIRDFSGNASHGGALKITLPALSAGIKITPKNQAWLPNNPKTFYTLRVRVFGTNTANSYLQLFYNGIPGVSPVDVQGYFKYSMPNVWTYFDIPINSYTSVSSDPVMYPQLILKANGGIGTVYIDEMKIFQGTPLLINSRYASMDKYQGGYWNDSNATSQWAIQTLSGNPNVSVTNGQLIINTSDSSSTQSVLKITGSSSPGKQIYTLSTSGEQIGMHMRTQLLEGIPDLSLTQVQVTLKGTTGPGKFNLANDIAVAAEIGRISNRTLRLAFNPTSSDYQVEFQVKHIGTGTILIDNTLADIDNDDPNYGDNTLFP